MVKNPTGTGTAQLTGKELGLRIGEPYSTIDYWAKIGLLAFTRRGSRRLFDSTTTEARCRKIRELQDAGLNLAAIKRELSIGTSKANPGQRATRDVTTERRPPKSKRQPSYARVTTTAVAAERLRGLSDEFDALLERMQRPEVRLGLERGFRSRPEDFDAIVRGDERSGRRA